MCFYTRKKITDNLKRDKVVIYLLRGSPKVVKRL